MPAPSDPTPRGRPLDVRLEVVIDAEHAERLAATRLDLDRLPDPDDRVRALVTPEELARLEAAGVGVEVVQRLDVTPLDGALAYTDDDAQEWLTARLRDIPREKEAR